MVARRGFEWFEREDSEIARKRIDELSTELESIQKQQRVKLIEGLQIIIGKRPGKVLWKNMLRVDLLMLALTLCLILASYGYIHDMKSIQKVKDDPCSFVRANIRICQNQVQKNITLDMILNQNLSNLSFEGITT